METVCSRVVRVQLKSNGVCLACFLTIKDELGFGGGLDEELTY